MHKSAMMLILVDFKCHFTDEKVHIRKPNIKYHHIGLVHYYSYIFYYEIYE